MKPADPSDHTPLFEAAEKFAQANLNRNLIARDKAGPAQNDEWRDVWQACADYGLLGLNIPTEYGGKGYDLPTAVGILERIGYGSADHGLTLALNGQIWAVQEPVLSFGTAPQKQTYLPKFANGEWLGAHCLTEAETGSDAMAMQTTAKKDGDSWVLNGAKSFVGMGSACDVALIFASTAPKLGQWGISAFLVHATDTGFKHNSPDDRCGLRTFPYGGITLKDCRIPADRILGKEGAGLGIFQHTMVWERSFIFTSHIGAMARQLEKAVAFAKGRKTFGKSIIEHQSVSNRLADMKLRADISKLLLDRQVDHLVAGRMDHSAAAGAKLFISEALLASSLDAVRIHGARGYSTEYEVERDLRDTLGGVIYSGTSDIQREIIARLLP